MKIPSQQEIQRTILTHMQSELKDRGLDLPLASRSVWVILSGVLATALTIVYHYGGWIYRQIFPQTQDEDALLLEGERFGLFPKPATATKVVAVARGIGGSVIPAGWQASVQGTLLSVEQSVEIGSDGTVGVNFLSHSDGTLASARHLNLTRSIAGVESRLEVVSWMSGSDAESIADFRLRVISTRQNRPQGGSIADYIQWSLEVPGIYRVLVMSRQAGFIVVFPITQPHGSDRIPTAVKRQELEYYLNNEDIAPLGVADIMVGEFQHVDFSIEVLALEPNQVAMKEKILQAWQTYFWDRFPRQFQYQIDATHIVSKAQLVALAVAAGAHQLDMQLSYPHNKDVNVLELAHNQLAQLKEVVWS